MIAASNSDLLIAKLAVGGIAAVFFWRLIVWVRDAPVTPDPWDAATEEKLSAPEIEQTCHHCSTPQKSDAWFCPHCGSAVGPYNNLMPFVCVFSMGEVLRNGVASKTRSNPLIIVGYVIYSLGNYLTFAPLYWVLFFTNLRASQKEKID